MSKPERARYERVRAFDTNNEWIKPRTKHFLCRELFITQNRRIFITGAPPQAGTGLKMQINNFFFKVTLWGIYRWLEIYRGLVTYGSLIRHFGNSLRSKRFCAVREQRITGRWMEGKEGRKRLQTNPWILKTAHTQTEMSCCHKKAN